MEVLCLTVFLSLCLAVLFTLAFVRSAQNRHAGAWERESLLPLAPEVPAGDQPSWLTSATHELK
jgi:hypothetical protein